MRLDALAAALPPYARDIAQNLLSLEEETLLGDQQKWGCFLAGAYAVGVPSVLRPIEAAAGLDDAAAAAAKGAAAIMGQNNVYFRALSFLKNQEYRSLRARIRMNIVRNPGVPKVDFDLWCLTVSAINGCPDCLDAHEGSLKAAGVGAEQIQAALRIGAVVNAASRVLAAEAAARAPA